jgi:hypothetical protein
MNATTGAITGTPTAVVASTSYTVTVTDSATPARTATAGFSLAVNDSLSATTLVASHTLALGDTASYTPVRGAGGIGGLRYSVAPALPAGLNYSTANGAITGTTTTAAASASYTVTITDSATPARTATASFTLAVNEVVTATTAVADRTATMGTALNYTPVTAAGGVGALAYSVSPALPAGLSMNASNGAITGTPTAQTASATYAVTVKDSGTPARTATASFSLAVQTALSATTAVSTRTAIRGAALSYTPVTASGGVGTVDFSVAPALPAGLAMNATTGAITGTPTAVVASTSYTVTVTDSATPARTATASFSLAVNDGLSALVLVSAKVAAKGETLSFTPIQGSGGVGSLGYAISPALPTGLSLDANTGAITGSHAALSAKTSYTVTVTDSATPAHTATASFTLLVGPTKAEVNAKLANRANLGSTSVMGTVFDTGTSTYSIKEVLNAYLATALTDDEWEFLMNNLSDYTWSIGVGERRSPLVARFAIANNWSGAAVNNLTLTPEVSGWSYLHTLTVNWTAKTMVITDNPYQGVNYGSMRYLTVTPK